MIRWLRNLLGLCEHKWETIHTIDVYDEDEMDIPVGVKFVLRCEKCGDIKSRYI